MIQGITQSKIIFENQNNDFEAIKEALETFKKDFSIDFNSESLISVLQNNTNNLKNLYPYEWTLGTECYYVSEDYIIKLTSYKSAYHLCFNSNINILEDAGILPTYMVKLNQNLFKIESSLLDANNREFQDCLIIQPRIHDVGTIPHAEKEKFKQDLQNFGLSKDKIEMLNISKNNIGHYMGQPVLCDW